MAKNANMVFHDQTKRVFVTLMAVLTLSLTCRFAVDSLHRRAALRARAQLQAAQEASVARARLAYKAEVAHRHPASASATMASPVRGYVSQPIAAPAPVVRAVPSQNDPRSLRTRTSRSS